MQTVARACKHIYAVSHLQENASLCWVESTALFVWRDRCIGLQTLYWQRQADSYMCIVCTVSASVRRVFSFLSWDAAENAALLMWGIFGQMPFNLRACTQSHVIHSCMHMHWHTYNKHTTHACTHANTPTTHPFTHSAGKYLKINLSAVTLAFILSFVILEIRCASPVFSWRCTRQTDASPSWRSKPWSWRWERAFSSTSGCPRWIVYSLLAPRCVCLACLLFLILQAGSWPFLFDYCSTFLQQYPLLSLWVPDISSVGSWSSYGMGMCVSVCVHMYVCMCVHVCVCAYVCVWTEWSWSMHCVGIFTNQFILYYASVDTRTHMHMHTHACTRAHTHKRTHKHIHPHIRMHARTHAHTHIPYSLIVSLQPVWH